MSTTHVTVNAYTAASAEAAVKTELAKQKIDATVVLTHVASTQLPDDKVAIVVTSGRTYGADRLTYEVLVKRTSLAVRDGQA